MQNKIVNMVRVTLAVIVLTCLTALPATAQGCEWVDKTDNYWADITPEQFQACIDSGADVNVRSKGERTPLHKLASINKNFKLIKLLVDAGANTEAREDSLGLAPLHLAAGINKTPEMITALLDAGANVHVRMNGGFTPLHSAALSNKNPEIIKTLADSGADLNAQDWSKSTPLHFAARNTKNPEVIIALIKAGADGKAKDKWGKKPLDYAEENEVLKDTPAYWALNDVSF